MMSMMGLEHNDDAQQPQLLQAPAEPACTQHTHLLMTEWRLSLSSVWAQGIVQSSGNLHEFSAALPKKML